MEELAQVFRTFRRRHVGNAQEQHAPFGIGVGTLQAAQGRLINANADPREGAALWGGPGKTRPGVSHATESDASSSAELRLGEARRKKHGVPAASEAATRAAVAATWYARGMPRGTSVGSGASLPSRDQSSRITGSSALQADGESWEEEEHGSTQHEPRTPPGGDPAGEVTRGGVLRVREVRRGGGEGSAGGSRERALLDTGPASASTSASGSSDVRGSNFSTQRLGQHQELLSLPDPGGALSGPAPGAGKRAGTPESSPRVLPRAPGASLSAGRDEPNDGSSRIVGPLSGARPSSAGGPEELPLRGSALGSGPQQPDEGTPGAEQGKPASVQGQPLRQSSGQGRSPGIQVAAPGPAPRGSAGVSSSSDVAISRSHRAPPAAPLEARLSSPRSTRDAPPPLSQELLGRSSARSAGVGRWPGLGGLMDAGSVLQQAHAALPIRGLAAVRPGSLPMASLTQRREESQVGVEEAQTGEGRGKREEGAGGVGSKRVGVQRTSLSRNAVAGGVAGAIVSVCIHPIDTIKTLIQSQRGDASRSVGPLVSRLLAERGPGALYKGIAANLATSAPISAVYTSTYEAVKESLLPRLPLAWAPVAHCVAGACASVATSAIFTPSEAVKQRMQISTQYSNSLAALVGMARTDGVMSLYDGLGAVLARNIPNSIIKFLVYETLKKNVLEWQAQQRERGQGKPLELRSPASRPRGGARGLPGPRADAPSLSHLSPALTPVNQLLVGGAAGSTAAFFTTPFDVIKTRMQTQIPGQLPYSSVADAFFRIVQEEGILGLYRGVVPRLLIYLSQGAIFFASYEVLRRTLLAPRPRPAIPQLPRTHYSTPGAGQGNTGLVG